MSYISGPPEDQIKILKMIQRMGKAGPVELAQKLGEPYTAQDLTAYLKLLERENLLSRIAEDPLTYQVTNLGLIAIGVLPEMAKSLFLPVPQNKCFLFYTGSGPDKFTRMSACSLSEFRDKAERVDVKSLEFHVPRGDIENWIRDVLGDKRLADEIKRVGSLGLEGEALRVRLLRVLDSRIRELSSAV